MERRNALYAHSLEVDRAVRDRRRLERGLGIVLWAALFAVLLHFGSA